MCNKSYLDLQDQKGKITAKIPIDYGIVQNKTYELLGQGSRLKCLQGHANALKLLDLANNWSQ